MPVSLFLAKAIGLYFVIISLLMIIKPERIHKMGIKFFEDDSQVFITSIFTLILGILMVISHNFWVFDWRIWITVLCWLTLVKGILLLFFPHFWFHWTRSLYKKINFRAAGVVYFLFGLFFCWKGFF